MAYCKACGSLLDEEGICTREKCKRRKLQLSLKQKEEAKDDALETQNAEISDNRNRARQAYEAEDNAKVALLNL